MHSKIDVILDSDVSWTLFSKLILYIYEVQLQVNFNIFHCGHFEPVSLQLCMIEYYRFHQANSTCGTALVDTHSASDNLANKMLA
jgi:hypothetical protein